MRLPFKAAYMFRPGFVQPRNVLNVARRGAPAAVLENRDINAAAA